MFDEKFVKELPQDILKAQQIICEQFLKFRNQINDEDMLPFCLRAMAFAQVFVEIHSLKGLRVPSLNYEEHDKTKINRAVNFFNDWKSSIDLKLKQIRQADTYETARDYYASMFGKGFFLNFQMMILRKFKLF